MPMNPSLSRRVLLSSLGLSATAVALTACGTTDPARTGATAPTAPTSGGSATSGPAAGPVQAIDGTGRTVTLDKAAIKPATLEWGQTEMVVTLGVQPVAVSDPKGYAAWVSSAPLKGTPVDVGLRTEPSVESVAKAEPDLLVGVTGSIPDGAMAQMTKIAPALVQSGGNGKDQQGAVKANFEAIAALVGKQDVAAAVLKDLDGTITASKAKLAAAGKNGAKYVFAYANVQGNQVSFRMHGASSQPGAYAAALGLTEAWGGKVDDVWGIGDADLEALTKLPADTHFLYWKNSLGDPLKTLNANPLWSKLAFVKAGNVHAAADKIWVYGGPASMKQWVDDVTGILAG